MLCAVKHSIDCNCIAAHLTEIKTFPSPEIPVNSPEAEEKGKQVTGGRRAGVKDKEALSTLTHGVTMDSTQFTLIFAVYSVRCVSFSQGEEHFSKSLLLCVGLKKRVYQMPTVDLS